MYQRIKNELLEFIKYFIRILKESIVLIFDYIVIGIYLIVLTIIANKFNLEDLTYFNATLLLLYFSNMISYGITSGLNIYINQNINNPEIVKKYISLGFSISLVVGSLFTLLIYISKEFLFTEILKINVTDNYLFFEIMCFALILNVIVEFFIDIFKVTKEFKYRFITNFIRSFVIIFLISVLVYVTTRNIYIIAITYVIAYLTILPLMFHLFSKKTKLINFSFKELLNSTHKVNLNELYTVITVGCKEIIWNIGYSISGIILLNKSEMLYNSYSYFENVFDIINGIYFSIIAVCSINICNEIGIKNENKAFKHSIYAIFMSVIIWIIMLIIYIIFKNNFISGMNTEIQNIGEYIAIAYLLIQLFRYIDWSLNSYILVLGGKVKLPFILDIFGLLFFLTIFAFNKYLPNNEVILIFIIGADSIIKCIVNIPYFLSKKWIKNVNETVNLDL